MNFGARLVGGLSWPLVAVLLTIGVGASTARAQGLIRFVGTATLAEIPPVDFTVNLVPGVSATWEMRFQGVQLFNGSLGATQSGSNVNGTLFIAGGLATDADFFCCRPCNFTAVVSGARVDGVFDPGSCGEPGTFLVFRQ